MRQPQVEQMLAALWAIVALLADGPLAWFAWLMFWSSLAAGALYAVLAILKEREASRQRGEE